MTTALPSTNQPFVLAPGEGEHRHFLNHLATTKIPSSAKASMTVVEIVQSHGSGPPLHEHQHEDEFMVVLEGEIAFHVGDEVIVGDVGATVWLPHGVPHTFQVTSAEARYLVISASTSGPLQFEDFVADIGTETDDPVLPTPSEPDMATVLASGTERGMVFVGPPPAPLG